MTLTFILIFFISSIIISSIGQVIKSRELKRINRYYVDVVDDTFKSIQMSVDKLTKEVSTKRVMEQTIQIDKTPVLVPADCRRIFGVALQKSFEVVVVMDYAATIQEMYEKLKALGYGPEWVLMYYTYVDYRSPEISVIKETEVIVKDKSVKEFISYLSYSKDKFATTKVEKESLESIINNIKNKHGIKN